MDGLSYCYLSVTFRLQENVYLFYKICVLQRSLNIYYTLGIRTPVPVAARSQA
jgi:hypothetical protein